ncbi:hypothetical protein EBL_c04840 [Shimwellia blattae DSM 4481 = NBRC 105725]|uniref:Uncharacterized protein n=1 Tax=Shimwellia blattae (strain ATCC 29907 / DSM 4481 / JCM 1650 / NBRC 105725 / CDC 9005-74) TaxID=630626 RepID=I2B506_SHIBC|nr:hypothetical protein EBL_c04840 [Shimwellia blattae DSM 4481 = NBRC 105725]
MMKPSRRAQLPQSYYRCAIWILLIVSTMRSGNKLIHPRALQGTISRSLAK